MDYRLVLLLLGIFFALLPVLFYSFCKNQKTIKILFTVLTVLYAIIVLIGVLTNVKLDKIITIGLFENVNQNKQFNFSLSNIHKLDFIINILMFVPLGFLLVPLFNKNRLLKVVLIGFVFSFLIELLQLLLPILRSPSLSDILLNTLSCCLGVVAFIILEFIKRKITKKKN